MYILQAWADGDNTKNPQHKKKVLSLVFSAGELRYPLVECSEKVHNIFRQIGPGKVNLRLLEEIPDPKDLAQRLSFWTRKYPQTMLEYVGNESAETYIITDLDSGVSEKVFNLTRFCKEKGHSKGAFSQVLAGKRKQHHGLMIRREDKNNEKSI